MTSPTETNLEAKPSVHTREEFDKLLAAAKGPVLVDFIQPDCGACVESQPEYEQLAKDCSGTPSTIARVDVTSEWGAELANKMKVDGTPTALFAKTREAFDKGDVTEVNDLTSNAARRMLKCAR
jgi:thiol-disulfide isomerase/thioredoxin